MNLLRLLFLLLSLHAAVHCLAAIPLPPGTDVHRDVVYRSVSGRKLSLDLYLPPGAAKQVPLIIWIHGGAWLSGSKSDPSPALELISDGYAVAHVEYRFSQEAVWPAQIEDCQAAVAFLRKESARFRLDPHRFAAWGSSAGGHLAAMVGAGHGAARGAADQVKVVQAVVDWFGPTDFLQMDNAGSSMVHNADDSPESRLVGGPILKNPERVADASPIFHVGRHGNGKLPPFLIMHGTEDKIVPFNQSEMLRDSLKGRDVTFVPVHGAGHGFKGSEPVATVRGFLARTLLKPTIAGTARLPADPWSIFRSDNLVAWCIVPFDSRKRGSDERALMMRRLGIPMFAYDYRAEHIPTFDAEITACKREGINLMAWWFPGYLNDEARLILSTLKRHGIHAQLWITGAGAAVKTPAEQAARVESESKRIAPIAREAALIGCTVALYNHGSWFGEPDNQIEIIEKLRSEGVANVGIVYNFHHAHTQLEQFEALFQRMKPYLMALNINGMTANGETTGRKIMPVGQGDLDGKLLRTVALSGWRGPVGILNHTDEDAEARLRDNLEGLKWVVSRESGRQAGARPVPISWKAPR